MKSGLILILILLNVLNINAQQLNSSHIYHELQKLPQKTTVLYLAAHPDDENTRLISWLANEKKFRTAYLSLTRGDGGQNLIGTEKGVLLGIIRTHELMEARKLDGGEQFFTRAYDFGFSKTPEETLTKWNRDSILADMVWVIRYLQPDVIITRFPSGKYPTHGHHTTSAMLAEDAFDLAADPKAFPEQLATGMKPWQVKRMFFNASTYWNKNLAEYAKDKDSFYVVDVGGYNPLLGLSYNELAGKSRSMHKSQGFGSEEAKGEQLEYLQLTKGSVPTDRNPFSGVEESFKGKLFDCITDAGCKDLKPLYPAQNIAYLLKLRRYFTDSKDISPVLKQYKIKKTEDLILQSTGLVLEALVAEAEISQGAKSPVSFHLINRSGINISFESHEAVGENYSIVRTSEQKTLPFNTEITWSDTLHFAKNYYSQPEWLQEGLSDGMFNTSWFNGSTFPGTDAPVKIKVVLGIGDEKLAYDIPVQHKSVDPVKGEIYENIRVLPNYRLEVERPAMIFTDKEAQQIQISITPGISEENHVISGVIGKYSLKRDIPKQLEFRKGKTVRGSFTVQPLQDARMGKLTVQTTNDTRIVKTIKYDHIGTDIYCAPPEVNLVSIDLKKTDDKIGYIQGAGDEVAEFLRLAGYSVTEIPKEKINLAELKKYDVVIFGVRAYNVLDELETAQSEVLKYIEEGGRVIVQYNTNRRLKQENIGPYPITLGRDRVTEEDAPVKFINENDSLLNFPNKISEADFNDWVQERGLYFVEKADARYNKLFLSHDRNEEDLDGALVYTRYGKGTFIYTGISFFRHLPAAVPGSYRLLANIIAYGAK